VRKLLIVFLLLPMGTWLWPSSASALECDPAISVRPCNGSGQKYRIFERSAFCDPVSSTRMLVNEPVERDDYAGARSVWPERTTSPTSAPSTRFSAISLAMGDELPFPRGRLDVYRAADQILPSRNRLQMSRVDAGMSVDYFANRAVQTRHSRFQSGVDVTNDGGDKMSPASPAMNPAAQPGSGALLIAGLLGMCAVARRRISSILG
jgi:hypothetical protein